jgi:hypothetical protein
MQKPVMPKSAGTRGAVEANNAARRASSKNLRIETRVWSPLDVVEGWQDVAALW